MMSNDGGETWHYDWVLRDDGPDRDLGYPSSVELADGSIFTVYYQKIDSTEEKCSLLWSRWRLPVRCGLRPIVVSPYPRAFARK
jgi:hypothetical protein